jgi:uncharacterized RDD family membrane protein YckC
VTERDPQLEPTNQTLPAPELPSPSTEGSWSARPPVESARLRCPACQALFGGGPVCQLCGQVDGLPVGVRLSSLGRRFGGSLLEALLMVVTLYIGWLIWSLLIGSKGLTPAKQILGMRVISAKDRQPANGGRMFLREFVGKFLILTALSFLTFGIGSIIAVCLIFGVLHQALWDRLAATLVVDGLQDYKDLTQVTGSSAATATSALEPSESAAVIPSPAESPQSLSSPAASMPASMSKQASSPSVARITTSRPPIEFTLGRLKGAAVGAAALMVLGLGIWLGLHRSSGPNVQGAAPSSPGEMQAGAQVSSPASSDMSASTSTGEATSASTNVISGASASASATAPDSVDAGGNRVSYPASNVLDGDPTTAWRVPGNGQGITLTITLPQPVHLTQIGLIPGYAKVDPIDGVNRFRQNRRVKEVRWQFSNGSVVNQHFIDKPTLQRRRVDTITDVVTIEILASRPGDPHYNNTPISEVSLVGVS